MSTTLQGHIKNGVVVFDAPMSLPDGTVVRVEAVADLTESVEARFQRLKAEWKADTKYLSNPNKIRRHPAFRAIIAMGMDAVPFMMRDLQDGPALWVWALPEITGENPVPDGYEGNVRTHTEIWATSARILKYGFNGVGRKNSHERLPIHASTRTGKICIPVHKPARRKLQLYCLGSGQRCSLVVARRRTAARLLAA
jgi:hypothetical protein